MEGPAGGQRPGRTRWPASSHAWTYEEAAAPYAGQSITVLDEVTPLQEAMQKLVPQFEEETGIDVDYQLLNHFEVINRGQADLLSGRGEYDAIMVHSPQMGLLHDPELVVLDEPFSGLDPVNSQIMKDVVLDLARQGRTVLFSTHIMEQAERMCDRIVIIARGEKLVDGTLAEVKRDFGGRHIALAFTRNGDRAGKVLSDARLVAKVDDYGASAEVELAATGEPDDLLRALVQADVGLKRFEVVEASLHAIFVAKVGAEAASAPAQTDGVGGQAHA